MIEELEDGGVADRSDGQTEVQDPFNTDRVQDILAQAAERGIEVIGLDEEDIQHAIEQYDYEALESAEEVDDGT